MNETKPIGALRLWVLILSLTFLAVGLPQAVALDVAVTYNANTGYVGSVAQQGINEGSVPTSPAQASGSSYTVLGKGNLTRQGFTFSGWNTNITGTGTTYQQGSTFTLTTNTTLYAMWSVPTAARLIGNGGTIVTVTNSGNVTNGGNCVGRGVRGITSDGTYIYFRPSGYTSTICKVTPAGVVVSIHTVTNLNTVSDDSNALVYGSGCLFIRKDPSTTYDSIYCISTTAWTLTSISLPSGYDMPIGGGWLSGNFIQFPDGRVGSVGTSVAAASWAGGVGTGAGQCPTGMYCKKLRLYEVIGTGAAVTTRYSTDFVLADSVTGWPSDDHGMATDGTYLYQSRFNRGYKVWALQSTGPSYLVFNGDSDGVATTPSCGAGTGVTGTYCPINNPVTSLAAGGALSNATFLGRSHGLGKYLIGDYNGASVFWLSDAATPPPGPGNPDLTPPSFTSSDTFTVNENIATTFNAATITVDDSATIVIASGVDGALFNILTQDTASALLRFKASPDFEAPTDIGSNNIYNITLTTSDSLGNALSRTIAIVITNLTEASTTSAPSVSGNVYKGVVITITVTVNAPGSVRFLLSGKKIPGCLSRPTSGSYPNYTATCQWKPPVMGLQNLTAELTPSDNKFNRSTSTIGSFWVLKRSTRR